MFIDPVVILLWIIAYLIGSIPSGFYIARLFAIPDIRLHGSGNIGASNVARVLGTKGFIFVFKGFIFVFCADFLKAFGFLLLSQKGNFSEIALACASICLLIGNCYSCFLKLQGGRGVSTLIGILAAWSPFLFLIATLAWLAIVMISRIPAVASLFTVFLLPFIAWMLGDHAIIPFLWFALILILWRHKQNIFSFVA